MITHLIVTRETGTTGGDQIPDAREPQEGHGVGALVHREAAHLGQRPGHQHAAGVLSHTNGGGHPGGHRIDVLQCAPQLHAIDIRVVIDAEVIAAQGSLHGLAQRCIGTGHHGSGELLLNDFLGKVGTTEGTDTGVRPVLMEQLAHQQETIRVNPLGTTDDQCIVRDPLAGLLQHLGKCLAGDRYKHHGCLGQCVLQAVRGVHAFRQLLAWQVAAVFPIHIDRCGSLRITNPEVHGVAIGGQNAGHGSAETAPAENGGPVFVLRHKNALFTAFRHHKAVNSE